MLQPNFDLQSHSTYSDGQLPPAEVVRAAADAGVRLLALSDHDSVEGVAEAQEAAASAGIELVPAVELSAVERDYEDYHVLGYRIDHRDPELLERTAEARADRYRRADRMAERLNELGFAVDDAVLDARRSVGAVLGRPHLATAVVTHPANAERLSELGLETIERFIPAYLIPGTPAYVPRSRPTVQEAIGWIHDAGGMAIWAHPFWDVKEDEIVLANIDRYRAWGVDGVECFYPTYSPEQTRLLAGRCRELGLLTTGSSDYHGPTHKIFSRFLAHELHGEEPELGAIAG
ncbi:MAG: PHP domain-containing protein [Solirubrobacteraceae bacterium]